MVTQIPYLEGDGSKSISGVIRHVSHEDVDGIENDCLKQFSTLDGLVKFCGSFRVFL